MEFPMNALPKLKHFIILSSLVFTTSCSKNKKIDPKICANSSANQLYQFGINEFNHERYKLASEYFKLIFEQHPVENIIEKSELMYAYSLYMNGQYQDAIDVYQNFILYFPNSVYTGYVRYMKFMAHYNQILDVSRDQKKTTEALFAFLELKENISSTSPYLLDASKKILLVHDYLAAEHLYIGIQRLKENNSVAAIIKFKHVLSYKSIHSQEALYRIAESYTALGLDVQAAKYFSILKYNFPNSAWYQKGLVNFKNYGWFTKYNQFFN